MKNQTKKSLEDAIPTLIEGWNVMSGETLDYSNKQPQFDVTEFNETFHIEYKWYYGECNDNETDPTLSDDNKKHDSNTIIIKKTQPFIDFVHAIVEALDTINNENYNYYL